MSDSDDDLLALADVGSENEISSHEEQAEPVEPVNPYPLEGKYRDAEDRAELDALPEIEREGILFDRAEEMQRFEERRYLAQRRKQMTARSAHDRSANSDDENSSDDGTPAAKRQRGLTGVTTGTKSSLEVLKSRRLQQSRRSTSRRRQSDGDSDYSASDLGLSDEEDQFPRTSNRKLASSRRRYDSDSDYSDDEEIRKSFRHNGRQKAEFATETDEHEQLAQQSITLSDVNRIRWGKTLFQQYCFHPGFAEAVPGCFVRVNVGTNRDGVPVYRLCQIRRIVPHRRYKYLNVTVDEAVLVTMAGSERTLEFGSCSDRLVTPNEFEFWSRAMSEANISLPSRRRAQIIFNGVRALSKRVLTSEEIDAMVQRRADLSGQRGANAVLARADLMHQRDVAVDSQNYALVKEIDEKLKVSSGSAVASQPLVTNASMDRLYRVNERNKRENVASVRKAEVQAHSERRKAASGATQSDPFSRLRTHARVFYQASQPSSAEASTIDLTKNGASIADTMDAALPLAKADASMPLGTVDDLIARIDIELEIDI